VTRLLYIAGGAVGMVVLTAACLLLTLWVDRTFGWVGDLTMSALVLAAGGGHVGAMLYKFRRRD
jgi:hypothetical protein